METINDVARDDLLDRERENKRRSATDFRSPDEHDQEKQNLRRETDLKIEARMRGSRKLKPASTCAMALLQAPRVGETSEQCCAVCHDDFRKGDTLRAMPCGHSFHERCIFRSLRVHHLCPVCDYELPTNEEAVMLEACARAGSELFRFIKIAGSQISRGLTI